MIIISSVKLAEPTHAEILADERLPMDEQRFPRFNKMVEHYFLKGSQVVESKLAEEVKGRMSPDEKKKWIRGILQTIKVINNFLCFLRFLIAFFKDT